MHSKLFPALPRSPHNRSTSRR